MSNYGRALSQGNSLSANHNDLKRNLTEGRIKILGAMLGTN